MPELKASRKAKRERSRLKGYERLNYPALHLHISRENEKEWREWALSHNKGVSFFASMIRYIGEKKQHPLRNALIQYAPEGVEGEEWLDDEEQVKEAALRWGSRNEDIFAGRSLLVGETARKEIPRIDQAVMHWKDEDGKEHRVKLSFPLKERIPGETKEERMFYLRFTRRGISLKDEDGEEVRTEDGQKVLATVENLRAQNEGEMLMKIWKAEMRGKGHAVEQGESNWDNVPKKIERDRRCITQEAIQSAPL